MPEPSSAHQQVDMDDLMNDPELERLHSERIARLKEEAEKRVELSRQGHGSLEDITEGEFLEIVTKTERVVCHFYHRDFERCKIMDKHLQILARQYFDSRFIKLSAPVRLGTIGTKDSWGLRVLSLGMTAASEGDGTAVSHEHLAAGRRAWPAAVN